MLNIKLGLKVSKGDHVKGNGKWHENKLMAFFLVIRFLFSFINKTKKKRTEYLWKLVRKNPSLSFCN